jgi:cytochrome b561
MSVKSSETTYGRVAVTIHWLTALAIFGMLFTGLTIANMSVDADKVTLLRGHIIMGTLVGVLTVLRIVWWQFFDRRPKDVAGITPAQARAAHLVHFALYLVILIMVASGIGTVALSGIGNQLFGGAPLPLPSLDALPPLSAHWIVSRLLLALLVAHIGAALWHQFVKRDQLLARMR